MSPAVYVQTNVASGNEVVAFSRAEDGSLAPLASDDVRVVRRTTTQPVRSSKAPHRKAAMFLGHPKSMSWDRFVKNQVGLDNRPIRLTRPIRLSYSTACRAGQQVAAPLQRVLVTTLGYGIGPFLAVRVERFVERRAE